MRNATRLKNPYLLAKECETQANLAQRIGIEYSEIIRYLNVPIRNLLDFESWIIVNINM